MLKDGKIHPRSLASLDNLALLCGVKTKSLTIKKDIMRNKIKLTFSLVILIGMVFGNTLAIPCHASIDASGSKPRVIILDKRTSIRRPNKHRAPENNPLTIEIEGRDVTVFFPDYAEYARVMVGHGNLVEYEEFVTPDSPTAHIPETMTGIYTLTISLDDIDYYETDILLQ